MISISGIKYQKELDSLPYFNKNQASILIGKKGRNLEKKIDQLKRIGYLLNAKNGLYVSSFFYEKVDKKNYLEYMTTVLRFPSYISLEYVLAENNLIPEAVYPITAITTKSSRVYKNYFGSFVFRSIKKTLFLGFIEIDWEFGKIYKATRAKALFDFLYLKPLNNLKQEIISDLRINWDNFDKKDVEEFQEYVSISQSIKMMKILIVMQKKIYAS